jgi:cytochrome P450
MVQWLPTCQGIAGLVLAFVAYSWIARRRPNLPPSPPASYIPGIGHALLLADTSSVLSTKFDRWAKELGPIFSLNVMGETMIVLSSYKVVKELLEGRGAIYSGRKQLALVGKCITSNANMAFIDYDDAWRAQRKATARELNTNNSKQYRNIQEREGYMLALSFLRQPKDIWDISYRFAGSVSLAAVYDYRVKDTYDENILAWRHNLHDTLNLLVPGVSYYDSFRGSLFAGWPV